MNDIAELLSMLREFEQTPEAVGHALRLSLAGAILEGLRAKGWSQRELAKAAGMKPSFVSRVIHSNTNCTFDVAGRLLHALGHRTACIAVGESLTPKVPSYKYVRGSDTGESEFAEEISVGQNYPIEQFFQSERAPARYVSA